MSGRRLRKRGNVVYSDHDDASSSRVRPRQSQQQHHIPSPVQQPAIPAQYRRWFTTPQQIADYEKYFEHCSIIVPRYLHDSDFDNDECNLPFILVLKELGLLEFCYISGAYCPSLVKVFYTNLRWDSGTNTLHSEVKGTRIAISMDDWATITHLPTDGVCFTGSGPHNMWGTEYDKDVAKDELLLHNIDRSKPITTGCLRFEDRLLHYLFARCILPRPGNNFRIKDVDYLIFWAIRHKKPINWGWFVLLHLREFATKVRRSIDENMTQKTTMLPYAILITHILRRYNVSLDDEVLEPVKSAKCVDAQYACKKGWKYIQGRGWRPDDTSAAQSTAEHDDIDHDLPPLQTIYPPEHIPPYMQQFMADVRGHIQRSDAHMQHVDTRLAEMTTMITAGFENLNMEMGLMRQDIRDWRHQHGGDDA